MMNDLDKLRHLLEHWVEHNDAHVRTYEEWARKTDAMGQRELSEILTEIAGESRKLDSLFQKALDRM